MTSGDAPPAKKKSSDCFIHSEPEPSIFCISARISAPASDEDGIVFILPVPPLKLRACGRGRAERSTLPLALSGIWVRIITASSIGTATRGIPCCRHDLTTL